MNEQETREFIKQARRTTMSENQRVPDLLLAWSPHLRSLQKAIPTSPPPPPAPEITPGSILDSLQLFDEIVQKVLGTMRAEGVEEWVVPEDTPAIVRAVLKAVAEVSNGK